MRKRIKWGNIYITFIVIATIITATVERIQNKPTESEQLLDETNYIQSDQKFVYEPKKEVKNDVELIAEEIGIEYELFEAIIRHETGNRTSKAFKEKNNPCGMMYWNGKRMALKKYETIEDGYKACAKNLKNNYIDKGLTTIEQIQKKYAPIGINDKGNVNQYWVSGVTKIYNDLKGE